MYKLGDEDEKPIDVPDDGDDGDDNDDDEDGDPVIVLTPDGQYTVGLRHMMIEGNGNDDRAGGGIYGAAKARAKLRDENAESFEYGKYMAALAGVFIAIIALIALAVFLSQGS
jgi:hypothetical protein